VNSMQNTPILIDSLRGSDGLPLTALREECAEADLDQIAAREQTLQNEMKDLHNRLRL